MRRRVGQGRLRAGRHLRLLPGHGRRPPRAVVPAQARTDGRARRRHGRGLPGRHAARAERSVRARRRRPVRLLHSRDHRARGVADRAREDRTTGAAVAKALDGHLCRCTGYGRILDAIQTAGEACRNGGRLPRTEPRRHSFFGEEFGLRRNPAFAAQRPRQVENGIGRSIPRHGGLEQALGEKPFVDDMRVPGHAARRDGAHRASAREDPEDPHRRRGGDAGRRARVDGGRCSRKPRHRPQRSGPAGLRRRRRADVLRRRFRRHGRRRHAVPRAPGGGAGEGRLRGARADHRPVRRSCARRPAGALGGDVRAESVERAPADDRLLARRRGRGAGGRRRTSSRRRSTRSRSTSRSSSPKSCLAVPQRDGV